MIWSLFGAVFYFIPVILYLRYPNHWQQGFFPELCCCISVVICLIFGIMFVCQLYKQLSS
jgi:hypothetical protein